MQRPNCFQEKVRTDNAYQMISLCLSCPGLDEIVTSKPATPVNHNAHLILLFSSKRAATFQLVKWLKILQLYGRYSQRTWAKVGDDLSGYQ